MAGTMTWYKTGSGRLGICAALAASDTVVVQAESGTVNKIINIFYEGGITCAYVDIAGAVCSFYTSNDEAGSEEFSNLQIQDSTKMWLRITNNNASAQDIAVDAVIW
jgi:hypothetical protein